MLKTSTNELTIRHSKALGGISRVTFQMDPGALSPENAMRAIDLLGKRVAPALRELEVGAPPSY